MKYRKLAAILAAGALAVAGVAVTAPPAEAATTGGSGGALTNRLNQSYGNGQFSSTYHVFAQGLDWSRPVGLMVYADGSGAYGLKNPNSTYLLDADGDRGLVGTARKHNMILLTPIAPPPGCTYGGDTAPDTGTDANCWYDGPRGPRHARGKAKWSSDLVHQIKRQYDIDLDRVVVGGFSSGAQWSTQFWAPAHGEEHSVDLTVAIGYGGAPVATPQFSDAYKRQTAFAWDTGTADNAYRTDHYGSIGGYNWYRDNGFTRTHAIWPSGVRHDRPGQFHVIMDREIGRFLGNAPVPAPSPAPTPSPSPTRVPAPAPPSGGALAMENCPNAHGCEQAEFRVLECRVPNDPNRPGKIGVRVNWRDGDRATRHVRIEDNHAGHQPFSYEGSERQYNNHINTVAAATQSGWNMIWLDTPGGPAGSQLRAVAWIPTC